MGKIRVFILDDHQAIIDGYLLRLQSAEKIEVVATANYGEEIEPCLAQYPIDVLILDIQVPTAPKNPNPYPILYLIPKILENHPAVNILAISMYCQAALIKAVMEAGASGYILKDDIVSIRNLVGVIQSIYLGEICFSERVFQELYKKISKEPTITKRQLQILSLCAAYPDESTSELAKRLGVAHSTFRNLLSRAYIQLGVRNRSASIVEARRLGLIVQEEERIEF